MLMHNSYIHDRWMYVYLLQSDVHFKLKKIFVKRENEE